MQVAYSIAWQHFVGVPVSLLRASPVTVAAQAGHLDTSFANKGIFVNNFCRASAPTAVALQSDGKIVVAGEKGG
jgi:hypothetical protein